MERIKLMDLDSKTIRIPAPGMKLVGYLIALMVGLIILFSTWFTISPEEIGVILRFGKFSRQAEPGLNFKLPLGIESVYKVPVQRQLKEEFGFRTIQSGVRSTYSEESFDDESLMLTGDLNAARVEWIVQYRILNPVDYLFKVRNTQETFRDMSESVMREIVGDRTVNEVLTVGRQEISNTLALKLQELCDQYETGIKVEQVVLQDVNPPDEVKPSFNEVNEAQQEREKMINQARSEYNKVIPKAGGDAQKMVEEAKGYALERVNQAQGDALRFNSLYREYIKAKDVTRQRIYLETMNEVLAKVGRKLVTDDKASGILPLFQFDQPKPGQNGAKNE